ncbi:MAG TPA: RtcB family protein [Vicinamibacterales bacterium]|nr:RtcB family protein [Vicinamibacterales bacterium]
MSIKLQQIDANRWRIPREGRMLVDGLIYASAAMMAELRDDASLAQVKNVAHLPGIVAASIAMPDIHWGYGFPIGGVAAMDAEQGVVSPGGVGYDINCGVRLLRAPLMHDEIADRIPAIVEELFERVPTGMGAHRRDALSSRDLQEVLRRGAAWAVERGLGTENDLAHLEERGCLAGADPAYVSARALERGRSQLGTLGSGNHFAEIQCVEEVFDERAAAAFGLSRGQITIMIHSGSRGLGHQVCEDHLRLMIEAVRKYGIALPDRQLCCAPLGSPEAKQYLAAMAAAANFAFANRQVMAHRIRESFARVLGGTPEQTGIETVYDVCHNIAKFETFEVDGRPRRLCVHRKGATRAYPPGHPDTPAPYREVGQPVLVPGDMGRASYVLAGTPRAMTETFGSSCHGAGRRLSRSQARRQSAARRVLDDLKSRGVAIRAAGMATVVEEVPEAYKDVSDVVGVMHTAGISTKVARLRPVGVIKG